MLKAVIMAGGRGERFWPLSRRSNPKQVLKIISDKSMLEETLDRLKPLIKRENIYIVTNKELAENMKQQVSDVNYIVEPMGRNTAAAIGLAAINLDDNDMMFIETTDHIYKDEEAYLRHIEEGIVMAENDKIVLIGIKPDHAHTGLGYIEKGDIVKKEGIKIFNVKGFKEKPDLKTAEEYVKSGRFLWNSGMFISKVKVMMDAFKELMPELYDGLMKIKDDPDRIKEEFEKLDNVSIDYGIMEKKNDLYVIEADMHWDDVGDWKAMERIHAKDDSGNIVKGKHHGIDTENCIIYGGKVVATLGVKDLVIINTKDAVLICDKKRAQELKKLVKKLPEEYL